MSSRENRIIRELQKNLTPSQRQHAARVAVYAVATADCMKTATTDLRALRYAAELHDVNLADSPTTHLFLAQALKIITELTDHPSPETSPARILKLAIDFDRMTLPQGKQGIPEKEALTHIQDGATHYGPDIVQAFLNVQPIIQPAGL